MPDPSVGELAHLLPVLLDKVHGDIPQTLPLHQAGAVQTRGPPLRVLAPCQLVLHITDK